jgi:hypothetical protein
LPRARLREPEIAVRSGCDLIQTGRRRESRGVGRHQVGGGVDPTDGIRRVIDEPNITVGSHRDSLGFGIARGVNREIGDCVSGLIDHSDLVFPASVNHMFPLGP